VLSILLGFLLPISGVNPYVTTVIYFIVINAILWPLQYLSAKTYAKNINFDAIIDFNENEIILDHQNKELTETKDWSWIEKIDLEGDRIWFTLNQPRPFGISIPKSKLSDSEIIFFEKMKVVTSK